MPLWLTLLSGLFNFLGFVSKGEQIILNWQKGEAVKKAEAIAGAAAPKDISSVEKELDKGSA